jgi:hypothetical protein
VASPLDVLPELSVDDVVAAIEATKAIERR